MKRLTRNLRDSSIEAFIMALETINSPSISYRLEAFVFLFCNAWELLMKARLLDCDRGIFYPKRRGRPRRSLTFDDCCDCLFTSDVDPARLNLLKVAELRDQATHLVIPWVPPDVMGMFQAGVLNYARKLDEWFGVALSERVPLGMMALVFDADPRHHSIDSPLVRRKMPAETARWLRGLQESIRSQAAGIPEGVDRFYIPINLKLAIVRNPNNADIVLGAGGSGEAGIVMEVPRDPDRTHPLRQKDVVAEANKRLQGRKTINPYDVQAVQKVHQVGDRREFVYRSRIPGHTPQYSLAFVDWLVAKFERDHSFFEDARARVRDL